MTTQQRGTTRIFTILTLLLCLSGAIWGTVSFISSTMASREADRLLVLLNEASTLCRQDKLADARTILAEVRPAAEGVADRQPTPLALCLGSLSQLNRLEGDRAAEVETLQARLALSEKVHGSDSMLLVEDLHRLARAHYDSGRLESAVGVWKRAAEVKTGASRSGPDHESTVGIARVMLARGDQAEAIRLLGNVITDLESNTGAGPTHYAMALNLTGEAHRQLGDLAAAGSFHARARAFRTQHFGETHPEFADGLLFEALLKDATGSSTDARTLFAWAARILEKAPGYYEQELTRIGILDWSQATQMRLDRVEGRFGLARELLTTSRELRAARFGAGSREVAEAMMTESRFLLSAGKRSQAFALQIQAKELARAGGYEL